MNPQRWQQIEEIFQSALDLTPAERDQFVAEESGEDSGLKIEVEKLLADYDSAESFIESPVWTNNQFLDSTVRDDFKDSLDEQLKEPSPDPMLGRQIGAYLLIKEIGRGGSLHRITHTRTNGGRRSLSDTEISRKAQRKSKLPNGSTRFRFAQKL